MKDRRSALPEGTLLVLDGLALKIGKTLGRGHSCLVYRAVRTDSPVLGEQTHIVKEFYPLGLALEREGTELFCAEKDRERFRKERESFARGIGLSSRFYEKDPLHLHPRPHHFCEANGTVYAVSDFTKSEILSGGGPEIRSVAEAAEIAVSLCGALNTFHNEDYLYLDIKPDNIACYRIDGRNHIGLFDFDTAAPLADVRGGKWIVRYSGGFAPYEQEYGHYERIGKESDVYAVGAVLFWMLTGRTPDYEALDSDFSLIESGQFAFADYPLLSHCSEAVRARLKKIFLHTLSVDIESRCRDADALKKEIAELGEVCALSPLNQTEENEDAPAAAKERVLIIRSEKDGVYDGETSGGRKNGRGTFVYAGGNLYVGCWKEDEREGEGTYYFRDGSYVRGNWKKDALSGKVFCRVSDEEYYEGGWNGTYDGEGVYHYPNGERYEGSFRNGKKEGFGRYFTGEKLSYAGEWLDDRRHGKGKETLSDRVYTGEWKEGKRCGQGRMIHANGDIYEGEWADNEYSGTGLYTWKSGETFEGLFKDDKTYSGCLHYADGRIYTGGFISGKKTGSGKLEWPNGDIYEGTFENDSMNGSGILTYGNGNRFEGIFENGAKKKGRYLYAEEGVIYDGEFRDESRHGYGVMTWPDHTVYEGGWSRGNREGEGKMTWPDGAVYQGKWKRGSMDGEGVFLYPDGIRFEGRFEDGHKTEGTMTWPEGDIYEGEYRSEKRNGYGVMTYAGGEIYQGNWKDDRKEGEGMILYDDGWRFIGSFRNGKRDGPGKLISPNYARTDEGIWKDGKRIE